MKYLSIISLLFLTGCYSIKPETSLFNTYYSNYYGGYSTGYVGSPNYIGYGRLFGLNSYYQSRNSK